MTPEELRPWTFNFTSNEMVSEDVSNYFWGNYGGNMMSTKTLL